jgi:hypothetical protein
VDVRSEEKAEAACIDCHPELPERRNWETRSLQQRQQRGTRYAAPSVRARLHRRVPRLREAAGDEAIVVSGFLPERRTERDSPQLLSDRLLFPAQSRGGSGGGG